MAKQIVIHKAAILIVVPLQVFAIPVIDIIVVMV